MRRRDAESFLPVVPLESLQLRGHEDGVQVRRGVGAAWGQARPVGAARGAHAELRPW